MEQKLTDRGRQGRPDHQQRQVDEPLLHQGLVRPNDGKDNHDKAETENAHQTNLLLQRHLDIVDEAERHGHDTEIGKDIDGSAKVNTEVARPHILGPGALVEGEEVPDVWSTRQGQCGNTAAVSQESEDGQRKPGPAVPLQIAE